MSSAEPEDGEMHWQGSALKALESTGLPAACAGQDICTVVEDCISGCLSHANKHLNQVLEFWTIGKSLASNLLPLLAW